MTENEEELKTLLMKVEGTVDSMSYEDAGRERVGLFARLLGG